MTVSLHLLRHADAGQPGDWAGPDVARPLSGKGIAQAERLARHLALVGFAPDAIACSPKLRARQTAEIVAASLARELRVDDRLGGSFGLGEAEALISDLGGPAGPLLVGHDPDLSDLLTTLVGGPIAVHKGALARVDVDGALRPGGGRLRWLLPPDLLPPG